MSNGGANGNGKAGGSSAAPLGGEPLFTEVCSTDVLGFSFGGRSYQDQLHEAVAKTKGFCGVDVALRTVAFAGKEVPCVWVAHNFAFLGGSLGCAEGERITRAFELAREKKLPIVVQCKSGGARMQEGTLSLMQMAKVSVAVEALRREKVPFLSVLVDPTYGGVSASYAMQADVRLAVADARIGFAGPAVILNTMCEMDQARYDKACPARFQSAEYVLEHGQIDLVVDPAGAGLEQQPAIDQAVARLLSLLYPQGVKGAEGGALAALPVPAVEALGGASFDYTQSRKMDRLQCQDIMEGVFEDFTELKGDGRVASDCCIRGGLARFGAQRVVVVGCAKGHTPQAMQASNYGMPAPAGYRTALRLFALAERFGLPVVTLVDTCGAWPSFEAEEAGQSEAIATNLTAMASLTVPVVTLIVGEGGSGGALGIAMGNRIGMLSGAYYGVISPEGAASILGRYRDDAHKAQQFPRDCQELATAQRIYADQLQALGVVDTILYEKDGETFERCPHLQASIRAFVAGALNELAALGPEELVAQRFAKFRAMGKFAVLDEPKKRALLEEAEAQAAQAAGSKKPRTAAAKPGKPGRLLELLAQEVIHGERSAYTGKAPAGVPRVAPSPPAVIHPHPSEAANAAGGPPVTAKTVLDAEGPEAVARWVLQQPGVLLTDTTMRDAHQSLLATRVRTTDIVEGAKIADQVLNRAFSFECWGGATYDVCYRFLHEDPWERLSKIRQALPNSLLQMLVRGANAVGYTSYPDNVVTSFIELAASRGIDVFRIFDCFNDVSQMRVSIDAVRKAGKVAEVCICYTADIMTSPIYDVAYYKNLAQQCVEAGAHIIGVKDMAGLLKPRAAAPLMAAIKEVTDLPVHFHTHDTSGGSIASALAMAAAGCHIIDFATAAMANCTSQPSLNAFLAAMAGDERDPGINYLAVEPYDAYWAKVREMYAPFECGMKSGTARVYDHEIPGGQYSNLMVQCQAMGIWDKWSEVLDAYRDVNQLLGDIVKVTPSSKCVGDLAIYLVTRGLTVAAIQDEKTAATIDFPASVLELLEGRLGFPHRGFPSKVQKAILKDKKPLTVPPSAALAPADFKAEKARLDAKWGMDATPEDVISSLLYPKVFADYRKYLQEKGSGARFLPTPAFYYGMDIGEASAQEFKIPKALAATELGLPDGAAALGPVTTEWEEDWVKARVVLTRVGPAKKGDYRTVCFTVNGAPQEVEVLDAEGDAAFTGPMADKARKGHVGSPMPGAVDKVLVTVGARVNADEPLCVVVAMKMEVVVKAPVAGVIEELFVEEGAKVVEAALLLSIQHE